MPLDANKLKTFLDGTETAVLDFKEKNYFLENGQESGTNKSIDFIKDVLAMTNTPRQQSAYIIVGIANNKEVVGVQEIPEMRYFHNKFNENKFNYIPRFIIYTLDYQNKTLFVIEFPVVKKPYPCVMVSNTTNDYRPNFLERNRVYYREGSSNEEAGQAKIAEINRWLDNLPKDLVELPPLDDYFKEVERKYKEHKDFFVQLFGEQIQEVVIYAQQTDHLYGTQPIKDTIEKLCETVIKSDKKLMLIVGEAGIGKTTTLYYLTDKMAGILKHNKILPSPQYPLPLYLELRLAKETEQNQLIKIEELIINDFKKYFPTLNPQQAQEIITKMLNEGSLLIFFDGLNEIVKDPREKVTQDLAFFMRRYPNSMFAVTTRPATARDKLNKMAVFEILPLNEDQQKEFLEKNAKNPNTKQLILNTIEQHPSIQDFVTIPFLFSLTIKVVERTQKVPQLTNDIIKEFLNGLYLLEYEKHEGFSPETAHQTLQYIATKMYEIEESAAKIPLTTALQYAKDAKHPNPKLFLETMISLNILKASENDHTKEIFFSHQSFLDYLRAQRLPDLEY